MKKKDQTYPFLLANHLGDAGLDLHVLAETGLLVTRVVLLLLLSRSSGRLGLLLLVLLDRDGRSRRGRLLLLDRDLLRDRVGGEVIYAHRRVRTAGSHVAGRRHVVLLLLLRRAARAAASSLGPGLALAGARQGQRGWQAQANRKFLQVYLGRHGDAGHVRRAEATGRRRGAQPEAVVGAHRVLLVRGVAAGGTGPGTEAGRPVPGAEPALLAGLLLERGRVYEALLEAGPRHELVLGAHVGQAPDLQALGDLEQRAYLLLGDVYLPLVHELDGCLELGPLDVLHYDYWVLARVVEEQGLEVGTAGRQDHLVGLDRVSVAGEGHVDEALALEQLIEHVGQVGLVVVPAQAELLGRAGPALLARHRVVLLLASQL